MSLLWLKHSGFTDGYNIAHLYQSESPENITGISSKSLYKKLTDWGNTAFWDKRLPLAEKVHKKIMEITPYIYLFSLPTSAYYAKRLDNITIIDPSALFASVRNWRVNTN